jgi:hypothetical protein
MTKPTEAVIRDRCRRLGYDLRVGRQQERHAESRGAYMLVHARMNLVVAGADFDLPLDEVERRLDEIGPAD